MKLANLLLLIVALTIAACSPPAPEETPTAEPTTEGEQPAADPTQTGEPDTPEATPEQPATPAADSTVAEAYPAPETGAPSGAEDGLSGTQWTLTSFESAGEETPMVEGTTVTLQFQAGGQAAGSGGCNSYGTEYQVEGNTLSFGEVISTMMACADEAAMEQEERFYAALNSAGEFEMTKGSLTIRYDDGQSALHFAPSAAEAAATEVPQAYPGS